MKDKNLYGHNSKNKTLVDFIEDKTGRVKITNDIVENYLVCDVEDRIVDGVKHKNFGSYKEKIIYDSEVVGLRCRINVGGSKTWLFEHKPKKSKSTERFTIGSFPELKVLEARSIAKELKSGIILGKNPKDIINDRTGARTLGAVTEEWVKNVLNKSKKYKKGSKAKTRARIKCWLYLKPNKGRHKNAATLAAITKNFPSLNIQKEKIINITKDQLVAYHDAITERSPSQANRVIDDIQQIFNYAIRKKDIEINICKFAKTERNIIDTRMEKSRPFTKVEHQSLVRASLFIGKKYGRQFVAAMALLTLIGTGRRKDEIMSLRWDQVPDKTTFKELIFLSKDTKNNRAFRVELLPKVSSVLKRMYAYRTKNKSSIRTNYVFPAIRTSKTNYLKSPNKTWNLIVKKAKDYCPTVEYKCIHFLRHTYACLLLQATGDIKLVAKMMNWKTLRVAEIYADYLGQDAAKMGTERLNNFLHVA